MNFSLTSNNASNNRNGYTFSGITKSLLTKFVDIAISLLRTTFRSYANHRVGILNDSSALLSQVLNFKVPSRNYVVIESKLLSSLSSETSINSVVAAILVMLQSLVGPISCAPTEEKTELTATSQIIKSKTKRKVNHSRSHASDDNGVAAEPRGEIESYVIETRKACFVIVSSLFKVSKLQLDSNR